MVGISRASIKMAKRRGRPHWEITNMKLVTLAYKMAKVRWWRDTHMDCDPFLKNILSFGKDSHNGDNNSAFVLHMEWFMWEIYTFFMLLKTILGIFAFSCVWIIELKKLVEGKLGISATTLKKGKKKEKKKIRSRSW